MSKATIIVALLILSACAPSPQRVKSEYISDNRYSRESCAQLATDEFKEKDVVSTLSDRQRLAHKTDTWSMIFLAVPLSELSGSDVAGILSREKGKQEAVQRVQAEKNCAGTQPGSIPSPQSS
ncbi:hypothetical protein [Acetobacter nitrogenifigens]|uniref:hypothetical protein n=1 Tax=Acetobacter nitrogenifigens TaxID=285268 RepID=UPI00047B6DAD|nr:hypothetical protein [Acetobacter nitrogenifigens]